MRLLIPALLLVVAACSFSRHTATTYVDRNRGHDGGWKLTDGDVSATIDAEGDGATVTWLGRTFILKNAPKFRGTITTESIHLRVDIHELVINQKQLSVRTRKKVRQRTLEDLPNPVTIKFAQDTVHFSQPR